MATIDDVCDYILERSDAAGTLLNLLKLQKLAYYVQAWFLAWEDRPMFQGKFQAWVHGPVSRALYDRFKETKSLYSGVNREDVRPGFDSRSALTEEERRHIDIILDSYAGLSGSELEDMTHRELPWREARGSLPPSARCECEISEDTMRDFYAKLTRE